ncbi:MAG: hypothetical protein IM631_05495 [Cytophagales bacterium]|jgi:hypothetical protein|nr:hypothetical protein [Cytophagales bacterium]MCA6366778.1 hypothetical protein [Cytophagales bacterium]MCA6370836.1 hypothetical protein [Cytophagales bacterium]MCA6375746.1 hypothetical protein [Cytophagales bacterium]MCA6384696.1 hypothetical protein [Cytophagales bacterium]
MKANLVYVLVALAMLSCGKEKVEQVDIDQLVRRMTEASGGDSVIASIQTHVAKYTSECEVEKTTSTVTFKRPNKIRIDVFDMTNTLIFATATNGKEAWEYVPMQGVSTPHKIKTAELISLAEHWIDEWRLYKRIGLKIKHLDDIELSNHRKCYKMQITDRFGIESFYYVNKETYLMARIDYPVIDGVTGSFNGVSIHDFKAYGDIDVLFPIKEIEDENKIIQLMKFVNNTDLHDSIFEVNRVNIPATSRYLQQIAENGRVVNELPHLAQQ